MKRIVFDLIDLVSMLPKKARVAFLSTGWLVIIFVSGYWVGLQQNSSEIKILSKNIESVYKDLKEFQQEVIFYRYDTSIRIAGFKSRRIIQNFNSIDYLNEEDKRIALMGCIAYEKKYKEKAIEHRVDCEAIYRYEEWLKNLPDRKTS